MATKKYGYNQYKPAGQAGMDIVDAELNRYSPAFDYLSGFVTRSQNQQVDDDRDGTAPTTPSPTTPTPTTPTPTTPTPTTPTPTTPTPTTPTPTTPTPTTPTPTTPTPTTPTPTTPTPTTPTPTTPTPYSSEFETEQDAKDYISAYYEKTLGRPANFGTTTDDTDASYWLKNFVSGADNKASFESNVKLGDEYKEREDLKTAYTDSGRAATEQELDAMMGTDTAANTANTQFLADYATKLGAAATGTEAEKTAAKAVVLDTGVQKDASGAYDTSGLSAAEATKFGGLSDAVKNVYSQDLKVGDLEKTTTQGGKQSSIDTAITDAYKLLGRKPDSEGYDYWAKQLKLDPTFDLASSFKQSEEYKYKNPT
jgi:hypothetical protein